MRHRLYSLLLTSVLCLNLGILTIQASVAKETDEAIVTNQWKGKKVIFLGDSISDKRRVGTTKCYWEYLAELLGIDPVVLAKNGNQWNGVMKQAELIGQEVGNDFDAIIIFAGTNDYNAGIPIGEWYDLIEKKTELAGPDGPVMGTRKHRVFNMDADTFKGRINLVMSYLKSTFPDKQIILLTPIHRGLARFNDKNIQPEETFANKIGLFVDEYVTTIKQTANVWAVPVIDLNALSGIFPIEEAHGIYVAKKETDRLHPNAKGHYRMAKALQYQLLCYPASFNE